MRPMFSSTSLKKYRSRIIACVLLLVLFILIHHHVGFPPR
jgi:hypothetical protein